MKLKLSFLLPLFLSTFLSGCVNWNSTYYPLHKNITVTVFWVGEEGSEENENIPNKASVWDDEWQNHYGGVDDPNSRNGYLPLNFTPNENPFYFALPYNDFDDNGSRKSQAYDLIYWSGEKEWKELESMCKNRWIRIIKGSKTAYAQWEDAGPFGENDGNYVFGSSLPSNKLNNNAGLDVSPAVKDYLELNGMEKVNWQFVEFNDVPDGPWRDIITVSQVNWK